MLFNSDVCDLAGANLLGAELYRNLKKYLSEHLARIMDVSVGRGGCLEN
jgi:hypothetical protein